MKSKQRALAFIMRNRLTLGMSFALVLLFTFSRPANALYNIGMFWKRASASFSWPFTTGTDASYSFGSSVEIAGNVARLKSNDQVDSDNTATGFAGGTLTGATWDSTNNYVRLSQTGTPTNNAELDSSWTPKWSNLVAYWKMNNNWNDSKGSNNGTASGTVAFSTAGKLGTHAGSFTAAGYVTLGTGTFTGTDYSVCAWVYPTNTSTQQYIYRESGASGHIGVLYYDAGGAPIFLAKGIQAISSKALILNQWSFVCGVRNGTNVLVYINAVLADSWTGASGTDTPTTISFGGSQLFSGKLDDLATWNTYLSASDIQIIYNRQSAKYSGTFTSRVMDAFATGMSWTTFSWIPTLPFMKELPDYASGAVQNETSTNYSSLVGSTGTTGDNNLMTGIIGLWHLNEASGTTGTGSVADDSGQGNTGTPTSVTFGINGKLGNGARFGGSPSKIVTTNTAVSINTKYFSNSAWFRTTSTADAKITSISNDTHPLQILSGGLRSCLPGFCAAGATVINDGQWHHAVLVSDATSARVYLDGKSTPEITNSGTVAGTVTNPLSIGTACNSASGSGSCSATLFFVGDLDEVALWNRPLHVSEIQQLYRRGANRLKHQVRVCTALDCSDDSMGANWKGPDGTNQTYFSELNNNSAQLAMTGDVQKGLPSMLFSNFTSPVGTSRYFQYRTIFESDDTGTGCNYGAGATWCSPELKSVTVDPTHYDSTSPTIIGQTGVAYFALSNFTETLGASCPSGIGYNLGVGTAYSSATWYWWDSSANSGAGGWVAADGTVTKSNSAATIASHANTFRAQVGTSNTVYFKAFLKSSGTTSCELDQLSISGLQ